MSVSDDFSTVKQLGAGMGGICRLVRRRADQRLYALKELELPADPGEASAVQQEVHILASLEHPFIVRYFDSFVEMRKLFLVMEYAPNGSLHTVLAQHQRTQTPIAEEVVWRYILQLLLGLHTIHTCRVVHRDIKPHNIFLGANDTVKIGDFGVSRMLSGSADLATTLVGSPGYLAPELCSGEPYNEKADIWALGVTLVELCALRHPFGGAGSQAALVMKIMGHSAPPTLPATCAPHARSPAAESGGEVGRHATGSTLTPHAHPRVRPPRGAGTRRSLRGCSPPAWRAPPPIGPPPCSCSR